MNRTTLLLAIVLVIPFLSGAQADQPIQASFHCETQPHLIKRDSTGAYWGCDAGILYEGKKGIKLFDANNHLLEEGEHILRICGELSYREGKWSFYYPNGQLKSSGVIDRRRLSGVWRYYYDNSQLKELVTYDTTYCGQKSGLYESYARDGKMVERGYYCLHLDPDAMDTITVLDPVTETETITIHKSTLPGSVQCGEWKGYDAKGILIRRKIFPTPAPFKREKR